MDAPFVGISSAGANRFNLTFPGISGEYPLITERTEYGVKVKEMLGTAGWDGILNDKLSDIDEHACRHVSLASKPALTLGSGAGGYTQKEVDARNEERAAITSANNAKDELREALLITQKHSFGTALVAAWKANAPMMSDRLRKKHTGTSGASSGKIDGKSLFEEFLAEREFGDESRQDRVAERKLEGVKGRLPKNVTETQFSKHVNDFIQYTLPYLERPMKPKLQVQWVLDALPADCSQAPPATRLLCRH